MAEVQPRYFDIEDTQTGKKYRIETDDPSATYDDAVEYFSSLPEQDWTQFEVQAPQAPAPSVTVDGGQSTVPAPRPTRSATGWDSAALRQETSEVLTRTRVDRPEVAQYAEQLWQGGIRSPREFNAALRQQFPDFQFQDLTSGDMAALKKRDAWLKAQGLKNQGLFTSFDYTGEVDPTAPDSFGESLVQSTIKGGQNIANTAVGLGGAAASLLGFDGTAEDLLNTYIENQAAIHFNRPDAVGTLDNLEWDNAAQYGAEAVGELLPSLASSFVAGTLGRLVGQKLSAEAAEIIAGRSVANMVQDLTSRGVAQEVAENLAVQTVAKVATRRTTAGAVAGSSMAQETGRIFGDTYRDTGEMAPVTSVAAGIVSGAFDSLLPIRFLENLGINGAVTRQAFGGGLGKLGAEAGKGFLIEGATEALQEFIAELPSSYVTGESPFTAEVLDQMVNAFVKGGIGGATVGGASAAATNNYTGPQTQVLQEREATIPELTVRPVTTARGGRVEGTKYRQEIAATKAGVERVAGEITSQWENQPNVTVEESFFGGPYDNDALGVYTGNGNIALNAEALAIEAQERGVSIDTVVESVMFHEALGHYGLEALYGQELDSKLWDFYENGAPEFRRMVDKWIEDNPEAYLDQNGEVDVVRASEEVLAEIAQEGEIPRSILDELINMIKDFMRKAGMDGWSKLRYSEREIRTIVAMGQAKVRTGDVDPITGQSIVKYLRNWHGSGKDFDRFDHSFMGTGEGNQAFGWGTYTSDLRPIGESYRDMLGEESFLFNGVELPRYSARNLFLAEAEKFFNTEVEVQDAEIGFSLMAQGHTNGKPVTGRDIAAAKHYYIDGWQTWTKKQRDEAAEDYQAFADFVNSLVSIKNTGKLYEVELPDDALWLEWENPIKEQPKLVEVLNELGVEIVDDTTYRNIQTAYAQLRARYNELSAKANDDWGLASEADAAFEQLQEINSEYLRLKKLAQNTMSELSDGQDAYAIISDRVGSDKEASLLLRDKGVTGNRYLANNIRQGRSRKNDGTDKFNHVIFDDSVPKIVNKYARRRKSEPKVQPLTIEELSADDLFNSLNALDILNGVVENYEPATMTMEELRDATLLREIKPSAVQKWMEVSPGQLSEKLFAYDIAAQKINDRVTGLYEKIQSGQYTMDDKYNFIKASVAFEDLTAKIFGYQSELGRALRAIQELSFTRNKVMTIRDALAGLQMKDDTTGLAGLDDPETFERYARNMVSAIQAKTKESTTGDRIASVLNTPRAIMSSYDLSAPLRQGLFFIGTPEYYNAFAKMFAYADPRSNDNRSNPKGRGEQRYNELMRDIRNSPNYDLMTAAGLFFSSVDGPLNKREEKFQSNLAQKVPGVRLSEIAYSGFLNKLRSDLFNRFVEDLNLSSKKPSDLSPTELETLKALGSFINAGSGRGNLPKMLQSANPLLNALFFSTGLIASRLRLLFPGWYLSLPKPVRAMAAKEAAKFAGIALPVLGFIGFAGALYAGDEEEPELRVEWDPRSSDFLKVRYGDTRYDVLGGMSQYLTLFAKGLIHFANFAGGYDIPHRKNSIGELQKRNKRPEVKDSFLGDVARFGRNKLAPNASFVIDLLDGEDSVGQPVTLAGAIASRSAPLFFQDLYELVEKEGPVKGATMALPGVFGVGMNTYVPTPLDPAQKIEPPASFEAKDFDDGENEFVTIENGEVFLKPPAERMWRKVVNSFFQEIMQEVMADEGWPNLSDKERAEVISEAKKEARAEAKEYMLPLIGME